MTDEQCEIYRQMSPAQRVATGCALHDLAFERVLANLSRTDPERSEAEREREAARRFLGDAAGVL